MASLLFPETPRSFPAQRALKILSRSIHVLCAGIFAGSFVFAVEPAVRIPWLLATLGSGALILLIDLYESGACLLQVRGLVLLGKIAALAALPGLGAHRARVVGALVLISVLSSHAPSGVRYFMVFGRGRIRGAETRG